MAQYVIAGETYDESQARAILAEELTEIHDAMRDEGGENVESLTLDEYISEAVNTGTIQKIDD